MPHFKAQRFRLSNAASSTKSLEEMKRQLQLKIREGSLSNSGEDRWRILSQFRIEWEWLVEPQRNLILVVKALAMDGSFSVGLVN